MVIYLFYIAQIRLLKANKKSSSIFTQYFYYIKVFLFELIIKLWKYIDINIKQIIE